MEYPHELWRVLLNSVEQNRAAGHPQANVYTGTDRRCNEGAIKILDVAFNTLRAEFVLYGPCDLIQGERMIVFGVVECRVLCSGLATAFNSVKLDLWRKERKCFAMVQISKSYCRYTQASR